MNYSIHLSFVLCVKMLKCMKFLCSLILFISLIPLLSSQDYRAIEVVVEDTLMISGEEFTYMVRLADQSYVDEFYVSDIADDNSNNLSENELESLIDWKGGVKISEPFENNFRIDMDDKALVQELILVKFTSAELLKGFVEKLEKFNNVFGEIVSIKIDDKVDYESILLSKLIESSKVKAEKIATMMGGSLGEIIELSEYIENQGSWNNTSWNLNGTIGWSAYPSLDFFGHLDNAKKSTSVIKSKMIRVKYQLQN